MSSILRAGLGVTALVFLAACGDDSDNSPSIKHLTSVPDPDPQNPFFNESTLSSLTDGVGESVTTWYSDLSKILPTSEQASIPASRVRTVMAAERDRMNCDTGSIDTNVNTNNQQSISASITFNSCGNDGVLTNGSVSINGSFTEGSFDSEHQSGQFRVVIDNLSVRGEESAAINGDINFGIVDTADLFSISLSGNALTTVSEGETNTLKDYQVTLSDDLGTNNGTMSVNLTMHSSQHGSIVLQTNTPLSFIDNADNPSTGKITLTHSDGSHLIVDADNGDPETFAYTVFNGSSSSSGNKSWTELDLSGLQLPLEI